MNISRPAVSTSADDFARSLAIRSVADRAHTAWISSRDGERADLLEREPRFVGPFDNLLRDRARARRVFDFDYTFEAYKPARLRVYGHHVLAVLAGDQLVGRVDAQRIDGALEIHRSFPEPGQDRSRFTHAVTGAAAALAQQLNLEPRLLGSLAVAYRIGLTLLVTMRGSATDINPTQIPVGQATRTFLDALDLPHRTIGNPADLEAALSRAGHAATSGRLPTFVLFEETGRDAGR